MASNPASLGTLRFGCFEVQPRERLLLVSGKSAALNARAFDVLVALAERAGRLVTKNELMDLVWRGLVVEENNLHVHISALRKVLGVDTIATVPGRGYRFIAPVETIQEGGERQPVAVEVETATAPELPKLRTNLPAILSPLIGRDDELALLGRLMDEHRFVTVVGAGGIGKTVLAQHLLAGRAGRYAHGVCWIELASVTDPAAVPGAIATALGVRTGGGDDPPGALGKALAPLEILLALDNAEHLLEGVAALVQALLDAAPGLRIVVTSQAPLKVRGEHLYRLGPLAVPERTETGAQALTHGAVALFVERAKAVDPRFAISDENAHLAVELCRVLEGLPLAIELAAARVHLQGLPRLLASMNDRLMLLTRGRDRLAPARQRTLRAALEWSHGLLAPREQRVFRRLAVVSGSASLDLLQSLLIDPAGCDESLDAWGVLDALDELVDRSLVVVVPQGEGAPRYRLLDSPRALALELLEAAGERPAWQERHARLVAAYFDTAYHSYFAGRGGAVDGLEPDLDNARQALACARALHDVGVELTLGATLLRALSTAAHSERMALADACAANLETATAEALPRALRLRVWTELSSVWVNTQKQRSRLAADRAVELARSGDGSDDDRFALCRALARAATSAAQSQDLARASACLEEALSLQDPQWPASRRLWCAEAASWVAHMGGDAAESLRRSRELYELERARGGNVYGALSNLVDDELAAGDAHAAVLSGQALVEALTATRHEDSMAFARINLAAALLAVGDTPQARTVLRAGWDRAVAFELDHCAACYLALLAALEGRPRSAARLHRFAETEYLRRQEAREGNESKALDRAKALTVEALGATGWAVWNQDGDSLRVDGVAAIAFATLDC